MSELEWFVRRIGANETTPGANDALDEDRIVDIVESVQADTVAFPETLRSETANQLWDEFPNIVCRKLPRRIVAIYVELLGIFSISGHM